MKYLHTTLWLSVLFMNHLMADVSNLRPIYRFYDEANTNHILTKSKKEGIINKYKDEGIAFFAFKNKVPGTQPLYRCVWGRGDSFTSPDANCEGHKWIENLGYVHARHHPIAKQIRRCYHPEVKDHVATTNPQECRIANYIVEGPLGYAPVPTKEVHLSWNGTDHLLSLSKDEGTPFGYSYLGLAFETVSEKLTGTTALYRCLNVSKKNHFVSLQAGCGPHTSEGSYGYIFERNAPGLQPLWECHNRVDQFATTSTRKCRNTGSGYRVGACLGFVKK